MASELSKSVYLRKNDLQIINAWIADLKSIHYAEPPMLPKRRSHTNPCLGVDGLPGVSFFPALEPNLELLNDDFIGKRNDTLKSLLNKSNEKIDSSRDRRDAMLDRKLTPPEENSTYYPTDWPTRTPSYDDESPYMNAGGESEARDSYYSRDSMKEADEMMDMLDSIGDHSSTYPRRALPFGDKLGSSPYTAVPNDPRTAYLTSRSAKLLQMKSTDSNPEEFPLLSAIAESTCPGFGPLIPYQPKVVHNDILLIVVFTGQHYDFIPSLEVMYRQSFPNMLYCGHPSQYVDAFLRKYQTVEHRSFSFLPTYTKATYECVLGAMEMNYEVKGYAVITDETLMQSWNIEKLDKNKIWVSNSRHDTRHVPVNKTSWNKLDPRGHKLPRLLDGIINTWKLFSYILVGQEVWIQEPTKAIKKRSLDSEEILESAAASYIPVQSSEPLWTQNPNENKTETSETNASGERKNSLQGDAETKGWDRDLSESDWDNLKDSQQASFTGLESAGVNVETNTTNATTTTSDGEGEGDVIDVGSGREDDESSIVSLEEFIPTESVASSPPPVYDSSDASTTTDESDSVILATPAPDADNFTSSVDSSANDMSTTPAPESSVGVPLYHVEHTEPPTPSTWHKPGDEDTLRSQNGSISLTENSDGPRDADDNEKSDSSPVTKRPEVLQGQSSSSMSPASDSGLTTPVPTKSPSSPPTQEASQPTTGDHAKEKSTHTVQDDADLKKEMEMLLDTLQSIYNKMLEVVAEYNGTNNGQVSGGSKESSGEGNYTLN